MHYPSHHVLGLDIELFFTSAGMDVICFGNNIIFYNIVFSSL